MEKTAAAYRIERFTTGPLGTNTYLLSQSPDSCLVIDPSRGCAGVLAAAERNGWSVGSIVLTHGHFDHITGIPEVLARFPAAGVWVHPDEKPLLLHAEYNGSIMIGSPFSYTAPTRDLVEGEMELSGVQLTVAHIPGHSPGGCALLVPGSCFSGDSLFAGSIGRTDFPGGNYQRLLAGIREKILTLPDDTTVLPGHGNRTTVGREKRLNPYLT
jgi:glyoxylase-like metal-dependent hydrolase (beta-lactamase superfamily II)